MRITTDVEALDLPHIPRVGEGLPIGFGEGVWRTFIVARMEWLPDGKLRLEGDIAAYLPSYDGSVHVSRTDDVDGRSS